MGDKRRFDLFGQLITDNFSSYKLSNVADVAGGKGYLQVALAQRGFSSICSFDRRMKHIRRFYALDGRHTIRYNHRWFTIDEKEKFDLVVGMHPDEGTDHLILYAVKHSIPFVVCPCCVKPSASNLGYMQYNWTNWWNHLKNIASQTHTLTESKLKMDGRNLVLIGVPK